jgi:uncharacterized membrane protein YqaE (UPF0057 family)
VVSFFCFQRCTGAGYLHALGVANVDSPLSNDLLCEGHGHHVMSMRNPIVAIFLFFLSLHSGTLFASHPSSDAAERREWTKALNEQVRSLTPDARAKLKKSIRTEVKRFKRERKYNQDANVSQLLLTLIALILPPLAIYLHQGEINSKFWIGLLLTLLIWVPGVVYALLVIFGVVN